MFVVLVFFVLEGIDTVTFIVEDFALSCVVDVMTVLPDAFAETSPDALTDATEGLLLDHRTVLFVVFVGRIDAASCAVAVADDKSRDVLMLAV